MQWPDAAVPDAADIVLAELLPRRAAEHPDKVYAVFEDGSEWTYGDTYELTLRVANGLRGLGIDHGDAVLSWLPNGPEALRVWFGINLLGGVYTPINVAYRGRLLEHAIRLSGARVMVAHAELAARLADIDTAQLETVVVLCGDAPSLEGLTVLTADVLAEMPAEPIRPSRPVMPWDPQSIIFTSGTTGPSKGVTSSYVHLATSADAAFDSSFSPDDRYMVNLPLFHVGGTLGAYAGMLLGGSISVVTGFDTGSFWDVIRKTGTTHCTLLGVMATFLAKQQPSPADRDHPLRRVFVVPMVDNAAEFSARFGVDMVTMFNMSEICVPIVSEVNPSNPASCGKLRPGVDGRLVDEFDIEVPVGEIGELVLRTDRPWALNSGYHGMPDATAKAWRNGWFHTGDAFRQDADGYFYFVDRMKDAIRRRGENISSFEVEAELLAYPAVREAAAVAVPGEHGEDEVLAVVAPVPGQAIDPVALLEFLRPRMAHFMVPRYVRVLEELPKTPTAKVQKNVLREAGLTPDTWDREAAGIKIRRERIGGGSA